MRSSPFPTLLSLGVALVCVAAEVLHEDPGLLFRAGDRNADGVMDSLELAEFYTHREDTYNGKAIADMAGGAKKATMIMDSNRDGKVSANEFLSHVTPRFHRGIAEDDFTAADENDNGSLDLAEYKNSNYGMERVPGFADEGFDEHFREVDSDKDGRIDKEEYLAAAGIDHFAVMDHNKDGVVTYEEYRKHKHTHYYTPNKEPVPAHADNTRAGFNQLDLNHDGKITRAEETYAFMPGEDDVQAALAREKSGDNYDDDDEDPDIGAED